MTTFVRHTFRVTHRNLVVWKRVALASAVGYVGEPLLSLVALGFGLGQLVPELDGMSYAEFIAPGLIVSTVMYTGTFEGTFGAYTRMVTQGTFDAILATPIAVPEIVAGEVLFGAIKACFGGTIVLLVATAFGLVPAATAILIPLLAFVAGLLFTAMAVAVTSLSKSYEVFNYYFTLAIAPMYLFGGVFFPLHRMPDWVQTAAIAMPMTHVVEISRALVRGDVGAKIGVHLAAILVFAGLAYGVAQRGIAKRMIR